MSRRSSYDRVSLSSGNVDDDDNESTEKSVLSTGLRTPEQKKEKEQKRGSFFSSSAIASPPSSQATASSSSTSSLSSLGTSPQPTSASKSKKSSVSNANVNVSETPAANSAANSGLAAFFSTPSAITSNSASASSSSFFSSSTTVSSASNGCTFSSSDSDLHHIASLITSHVDFPVPGVVFRDIFPIFRDSRATEALIDRLCLHLYSSYLAPGQPSHLDAIAGLETRGFLFGVPLAMRLGVAFVPIRKAGKLPPPTVSTRYGKEYGGDEVELAKNSLKAGSRVVVIDDLLATGGTLVAAMELIGQANCIVNECMVVIELKSLKGRERIEKDGKSKVWSLIQYD